MKNAKVIKPVKPVMLPSDGFAEYTIKLNKNQVDYGDLKSRKELKGFREQTKRHITVVGDKASLKIEKALNKFSVPERKKKITQIESILKKLEWQYFPGDIYLIEKKKHFRNPKVLEHRKSYVRLVKMPDMDVFYRKLNTLLKTRIPTQIPHITLFTKGEYLPERKYFGISIPSKAAFKKLNPKKIN